MDEHAAESEVVVVGAGLSGLAAAVALRRAGFADVVVLEKEKRLGGTWRDNTYPGCGCDVPALLYEYSFAAHPWERCFATQAEVLGYLETTAAALGITEAIRYGVEVVAGRWDGRGHRWLLDTTAGIHAARAVIVATGPWHRPRYPDIPGLDAFPGAVFHSARWDHAADLSGCRVAVIGNGASTVQFLPEIQPRAASVDIFQGTAPWVLPKPDYALPLWLRHFLQRHRTARRTMRGVHSWPQEAFGVALRHPWLLPPLHAAARLHLRRSIGDPALRRALTPGHRLGARRPLISNTYHRALTQPNVHLHPVRAAAVDGREVVGADGTRTGADAIILATGFHIGELAIAGRLHGARGHSLADAWRNGRRAYLGTSVAGFPNLFLLPGPNLLNGNTAVPTAMEALLRYITDAWTHLNRNGHVALDVSPQVQAAHNDAVQTALQRTVYTYDHSSYYYSAPGLNTHCWPWSTRRLLRRLRAFDPADYIWTPAEDTEPHSPPPDTPPQPLRNHTEHRLVTVCNDTVGVGDGHGHCGGPGKNRRSPY